MSALPRLFLQCSEERTGNPSTAIVGSEIMILDHNHPYIRRLNPDLAGRNKDAEVGNGSLRPVQKSFGDRTLILGFDGVELAIFRRATGADQTELDSIHVDALHGLFHE